MSSQPSPAKPEVKSSGMKASTSAPSRLPSAKVPQQDSLFDADDDLFAATKEPRWPFRDNIFPPMKPIVNQCTSNDCGFKHSIWIRIQPSQDTDICPFSQKKPQRVSLLFEDEDDEDKGSLFGFNPSANKGTPEVKVSCVIKKKIKINNPIYLNNKYDK